MKFSFKIIFALLLTTFFSFYATISNSKANQQQILTKADYKKQFQQIEILKKSMTEYLNAAHPAYTKKDIEQCENILIDYINRIDKISNKEDGLEVVKMTILKLNELNEKCDVQLIETGEREQIAEIINSIGNIKGLNAINEDITEEWRAW